MGKIIKDKKIIFLFLKMIPVVFLVFLFYQIVSGRDVIVDNDFMEVNLKERADEILSSVYGGEKETAFYEIYDIYSGMDLSSDWDRIKKLKEVKKILIEQNVDIEKIRDLYFDDYLYDRDELKIANAEYDKADAVSDLEEIFNVLVMPQFYENYEDSILGLQNITAKDMGGIAKRTNVDVFMIDNVADPAVMLNYSRYYDHYNNEIEFYYYDDIKIKSYNRYANYQENADNPLDLLPRFLEEDQAMSKVFGDEDSQKIKRFLADMDMDFVEKNKIYKDTYDVPDREEKQTTYKLGFKYKDTLITIYLFQPEISMHLDVLESDAYEEDVYIVKCCYFKDLYSVDEILDLKHPDNYFVIDDQMLAEYETSEMQGNDVDTQPDQN